MARPIDPQTQRILSKLDDMWRRWEPGSAAFKAAFYRIGERLKTQARLYARAQRIGNTGRLVNSISYMPIENGIVFGVFGANYAKYHEYGSDWTDANRRAMFYYMRKTGQKPQPSKGVVVNGKLMARPFIGPSIDKNRNYIIDQIRIIGLEGKKI
jgi:hypothetical protein